VKDEFTVVHLAILHKLYNLVLFFIDELDFDVDYHKKYAKLTLLHVIAKFHVEPFTNEEKEKIR
jgi:hypothetical protein